MCRLRYDSSDISLEFLACFLPAILQTVAHLNRSRNYNNRKWFKFHVSTNKNQKLKLRTQ